MVQSSSTATLTLEKKLQKLQDDFGATQKRVDEDSSAVKQLNAFAGKDGTLAKEQSSLAAANAKLAAEHTKLASEHSNLAKEQSNLAASQQARLRDELAALSKDISERLKAESAARTELAAELQRFKAAAPGAKDEAEEKLRARVKVLVAELLPSQAPAPAPSTAVPTPAPVVREFKLHDHRYDSLATCFCVCLLRITTRLGA